MMFGMSTNTRHAGWALCIHAAAWLFLVLTARLSFAQELVDLPDVIDRVTPSVVIVRTEEAPSLGREANSSSTPAADDFGKDLPDDHPLKEFFRNLNKDKVDKGRTEKQESSKQQGSGIVLSSDGFIVTANYVVQNAKRITVELADGQSLPAMLTGIDARSGIGLLKVAPPSPLIPVEFGDSNKIRRGQSVFVIGTPFGLKNSVSRGIVSALNRDIGSGPYDALQTDVYINQGHAGGPLFDSRGRVVGMVSGFYSATKQFTGISFSVPSNVVRIIAEKLQRDGVVVRGWIGVDIQSIDRETAARLNLPKPAGVLINKVTDNGPGAQAGLLKGDIILAMNEQEATDSRAFARFIQHSPPDSDLNLSVIRAGQLMIVTTRLGTLPRPEPASPPVPAAEEFAELGLTLSTVAPPQKGALVSKVKTGSQGQEKGLNPGDVIVEVGEKTITSLTDIRAQLDAAKARGRSAILVRVDRRGDFRYIALTLTDKEPPRNAPVRQ